MGASESKLSFRQGIFRLSEDKSIPADDPYWTGFWELPESPEDVFSLFAPVDIRRTRDSSLPNLETLVLAVTSRLVVLRHHPSFPDPELAPARDALNCIRVLTRLFPYVYEAEHLEQWEERFFWTTRRKKSRRAQLASRVLFDESQREEGQQDGEVREEEEYEDLKPLAEELLDTLVDLLFFGGFTIPQVANAKGKVSYSIWQSGVGCNTAMGSNKELENNRSEILRLLLTITSKAMYTPLNVLPVQGAKALTYITTCPDKKLVLSLLCSLLNTTMNYNPNAWKVPYDHVVWKDPKQIYVIYCQQLLLALLIYPIPEDGRGSPPKNYYRHFFSRLHQSQDFQFLMDGMTRVLNQPMHASASYLPGSQKSVKWAPEMLMLFWELLQCNKRFRSFIVDSKRSHDFIIICVFYAIEYKTDPTKQGVVRMCIFILQTMSVEPNFGRNLFKTFEGQDTLPQNIRIPNFHGTYGDFLITSIHSLLTCQKGKLDAVYPAMLAVINNVAAYASHLSASTCSKIIQLFGSMSSPSFLLANESNHTLLSSLLEFISTVLEHQFSKNSYLVYAILRSKKRFEALRAFTLESGQEEIELQNRMSRKTMSTGADGVSSPSSRQSSDEPPNATSGWTHLSHVPEEDTTFAIGEDDSDEEETQPHTPSQSSPPPADSRAPSVASSADESVPHQLRGMSEKARGKLPANQMAFSRQNSTTSLSSLPAANVPSASSSGFVPTAAWIDTWVPELPLHTILTIITAITPHIPPSALESSVNPEARTLISDIPSFAKEPNIQAVLTDPSPIRVHLFEWSPLSLGWYESLLWGFIFAGEMVVGSVAGSTPGTVGVWNGTGIKLFRVQEGTAQGPTLLAPRGAVDAVGSNLVQRIGNINLRGLGTSNNNRQEGHAEAGTGSVREV